MSNLFGEYKVFKCPHCKEYTSTKSDVCPKCSNTLTTEMKEAAVRLEGQEVKDSNRRFYKNNIFVGVGVFLLGGFLLIVSLTGDRFFIWSPIITLVGLGEIIYGLSGLYQER